MYEFNVRYAKSQVTGSERNYGDYINSFHKFDDAKAFADNQKDQVVVIRGNLCEVYRNKQGA